MKRIFLLIILLLSILALFAFYVEPNNLKVHEYTIEDEKITKNYDSLKIVHFSDTLYNNKTYDENNIKKLISTINEQNADIIVFTGDLLNKKVNDKNKESILKYLNDIKVNSYKYYILGNKDTNLSKEILDQTGFIDISKDYKYLFKNDNNPILISNGLNLPDDEIQPSYKIALIHKPDSVDDINNDFDLILAGHSLGGQIRIPFYKAIYNINGAKKYTSNYHEFDDSIMYISFGIGTLKYNARLFDNPSINVYRLSSK